MQNDVNGFPRAGAMAGDGGFTGVAAVLVLLSGIGMCLDGSRGRARNRGE